MRGDLVIQRVNGVKMLMKVLEFPDQAAVERAIATSGSISLTVVSYYDCTESVGPFELVDIRNLRSTSPGFFSFSGRIIGVEVDDGIIGGADSAVYVQSGVARVAVDDKGAQLEFILNLSVHFL